MKSRKTITLQTIEEMMALHDHGLSYTQIAEQSGVSVRNVANYLRTIERILAGKEKLSGDHASMELINEWIGKHISEGVDPVDRGVKMTAREVERIAVLTGAGKSPDEISEDLNRARSTVVAYITAIRQAAKGTFVHQSSSGVRPELIEPYLRKEGKAKQLEKDLMKDLIQAEVRMENNQETRKESRGRQMLDADNALLIAGEIEAKTPIDIISRLMKVDMMTVNRVRSYIGFLKGKENDKALDFRQECAFAPEAFEALEVRYGFFPKEKTPEDLEAEFRKNLLTSIDLMNDFLNSIDDQLRKMLKR